MTNEIKIIKTIAETGEFKLKEKGSVFIGRCCSIENEEHVTQIRNDVKKEYYDASHHCFAYKFRHNVFKYSDDGEPNGTAGIRILNSIEHFDLTDVLVIVIRYFGGVKLGVGPLGKAYYNAAYGALESVKKVEKHLYVKYFLTADFEFESAVRRILNTFSTKIIDTKYKENIIFEIDIKQDNEDQFELKLTEMLNGRIKLKKLEDNFYL
jgi:uncharacterized YigZ family protein